MAPAPGKDQGHRHHGGPYPPWLGDRSSVAKMVAERLDAATYLLDEFDQHSMSNKVGGTIVTGEGDGAQHGIAQILYDMTIAGLSIPPNADCFWIGGPGGPGKPCTEKGGNTSYYVNEWARWMTHDLISLDQTLKERPITTDLEAAPDRSHRRQRD